jgi:hypothetical protein
LKHISREAESVLQLDIPRRYYSSYGAVIGRRALPAPLASFNPVSLRIISERIVPQLVPAIDLEEHRKQTNWAGYLEGMIKRNDKELTDIFKRVSEEVMLEQGYPNTMKLGLWVHPYKLIANVCRALATSDMGRSFLKKFVFTNEYRGLEESERATNAPPGSSQRPREARLADVIASMASSHSGRAHLRDCVLKGKEELFGWRVGEHEMSVTLSERGGAPKYDGSDDIFIKIHLDSIPESIVTGRHPPTLRAPDRPPRGGPAVRETGPGWVSTPYVSRPPSGVIIPGRNPERRSTPAGPPPRPDGATPRGGATRFPLSDPVLNEVLDNRSVMEHLSAFQITDAELDLSRRVIEGELNLSRRLQGDRPAVSLSKQVLSLFLLACSHVSRACHTRQSSGAFASDCLLSDWTSLLRYRRPFDVLV